MAPGAGRSRPRRSAALGIRLFRLDAADIPADWTQRAALAVFLDRELALSAGAALIDGDAAAGTRFAELLSGPTILAARDPEPPEREPRLRLELPETSAVERRAAWQAALGERAAGLGPGLGEIAEHFALDAAGIRAAAAAALADPLARPGEILDRAWAAARAEGRRSLDGLAQRIEARAGWEDLVLPAEQAAQLRDLAGHLRQAWTVNQDWGWEERGARGLGAAALFAGTSGTGKTLAAEVLAGELGLDLYGIDLSQVVSKYIGETEKNLARIFAAAEKGGAILLFDEADALFGKRSEVKDSHDRYANVEVSYLLQRMEAYRGLAILTTNQKSALDQAFLRRLRHVISFPFPDAKARAAMWGRVFPAATPTTGLDPERLARLNLTGGSIRSIALNACFLAAAEARPVGPEHVLRAARREYAKLEKPFSGAEMEAFR